ncbi:MAG: hypothetical protein R3A48_08005 [Polyangiales bacterium]
MATRKSNERSLGFLPMLIMAIAYILLTKFQNDIGPLTSAPGFYNLSASPPNWGCIIPHANP